MDDRRRVEAMKSMLSRFWSIFVFRDRTKRAAVAGGVPAGAGSSTQHSSNLQGLADIARLVLPITETLTGSRLSSGGRNNALARWNMRNPASIPKREPQFPFQDITPCGRCAPGVLFLNPAAGFPAYSSGHPKWFGETGVGDVRISTAVI